jgi:hypothetical protein
VPLHVEQPNNNYYYYYMQNMLLMNEVSMSYNGLLHCRSILFIAALVLLNDPSYAWAYASLFISSLCFIISLYLKS